MTKSDIVNFINNHEVALSICGMIVVGSLLHYFFIEINALFMDEKIKYADKNVNFNFNFKKPAYIQYSNRHYRPVNSTDLVNLVKNEISWQQTHKFDIYQISLRSFSNTFDYFLHHYTSSAVFAVIVLYMAHTLVVSYDHYIGIGKKNTSWFNNNLEDDYSSYVNAFNSYYADVSNINDVVAIRKRITNSKEELEFYKGKFVKSKDMIYENADYYNSQKQILKKFLPPQRGNLPLYGNRYSTHSQLSLLLLQNMHYRDINEFKNYFNDKFISEINEYNNVMLNFDDVISTINK